MRLNSAVHCSRFTCAISLAPRPMTMDFGLGTRLQVRMRTKIENVQLTAAQVCCEQLVKSYREARDQGTFLLRYESFSCYNHGEYLRRSRDTFIGEGIREMKLLLLPTFVFNCVLQGFGKVY